MKIIDITREQLGSAFHVMVVLSNAEEFRGREAVDRAFDEVVRIERTYSRFSQDNELARLNARVGEWVTVSSELYRLIQWGVALQQKTEGAFDLSVKTVLEGWGYDATYSLQEGRAGRIGAIELAEDGRVRLQAEIELGGLGKGYALDQMVSFLKEFPHFCVNAGGDLWAQGHDVTGKPWKVLFEHPTDPSQAIGSVEVDGLALACSSPSRRAWRGRHHLVDPHTGAPAQNMLAVYTQATSGLWADAYATALFVMGYERARERVADYSVEAMLIGPQGQIHRTPGFGGELFMEAE